MLDALVHQEPNNYGRKDYRLECFPHLLISIHIAKRRTARYTPTCTRSPSITRRRAIVFVLHSTSRIARALAYCTVNTDPNLCGSDLLFSLAHTRAYKKKGSQRDG